MRSPRRLRPRGLGPRELDRRGAGVRAGFSMIELLVVVTILVLGTTIVGVTFEALVPGERLNASVRTLASNLSEARSLAMSRNQPYYIEYDLDAARYRIVTNQHIEGGPWIQDAHDPDERIVHSWEKLRPGVAFTGLYLAGDFFNDGRVLVRFDPMGAVSDHSVIVAQPEYESAIFTIEMLPLTGLIRFHDGEFLEREPPTDRDFD